MPNNNITIDDLNKALKSNKGGEISPNSVSKEFTEIDEIINKNSDIINSAGNWDSEDYENYRDYDVTLTNRKTEEELNLERAKNQGGLEQAGRFLMQAGLNEVVLGTVLGVSNIVDMATNLLAEEGTNDYTNPVSTFLSNLQNNVRERFEIYREDPNATWAIGDFGWWADNAVSIASTASMLIPSTAIAKGLSYTGNLAKIGKVSRGIAKLANKAGISKNINTLERSINASTDIATRALLSRTMENYQEARGVYEETYDNNLDRLNKMTDEERLKLISNNPQLEGKSNEEIASYISSVSSDKTFINDFAMLLFDIAQFKAISSLWKGIPNKSITAGLNRTNQNAINRLVQTEENIITNPNFLQRRLDAIKFAAKNPLKSVGVIEWSEGIEEVYQGIQTEKGKEVSELYFNPNFKTRTLDDYLTDDAIWEQAFWGVLGGIGFQIIGEGLGNLSNKVKGKINKNKLTDEEFALSQLTDEKIRENEIIGRQNIMQDYVDKMQLVNSGYNPFDYQIDEVGQPILKDGNKVFGKIKNKEEGDYIKSQLTNDFVTNITLNATDVGNYELLKDFISDANFNKFFKQAGLDNGAFSQTLIQKMDNVYEDYSSALHDILTNANIENENVAKLAARNISRNRLKLNDINEYINEIDNVISNDPDANTVTSNYIDRIRLDYARERLQKLYILEDNYKKEHENGNIDDITFNIINSRINDRKTSILNQLNNNTRITNIENIKQLVGNIIDNKSVNNFINEFNKFYSTFETDSKISIPKQDLQDLVKIKVAYETEYDEITNIIPKDKKDYQNIYNEIASEVDVQTIKRYENAVDKINEYLESSNDINIAQRNLVEGNINDDLKNALEVIKIGSKNSNKYISLINSAANIIKKDKIKKEQEAKIVTENDEIISEERAEKYREDINTAQENIVPSTGEEIQEDIELQSNIINVENPIEFVPIEEIQKTIDAAEEVARQQAKIEEENFTLNVDDKASLYAQDVVIDLFRNSPSIFADINTIDTTDANFNKILDYVIEQIIIKGVSSGIARQAAMNGIKLAFDVRAIAMRNRNKTESDKFKRLSAEIAIKSVINTENGIPAITKYLNNEEFISVVNEFIESYIKSNNILPNSNNKYYINVNELFNALLEKDNKQSYDTAKFIFRNLKDFIIQNKGKNFVFTNTKLLNQHLNNPETFIAALIESKSTIENIDNYMHIVPASKRDDKYNQTIKNIKNGDEVTITSSGNSIDISKNEVQIGYFVKVRHDNTNNSYTSIGQNKGFVYTVSKDINGEIHSNFDELFSDIINQNTEYGKKVFDSIQRFKTNSTTGEDWNVLMNNPIFKELYNKDLIRFPNWINTDLQKANYVLNNIANIIFYNRDLNTNEEILHSYENWKFNLYNNYEHTNQIQNKLNESKTSITAKLAGISAGKLLYSNKNRNINEVGLVGINNPIVAVKNEGYIASESGIQTYINSANFNVGAMGYLINDNPNAPLIALITDTNNLNSNPKLSNEVHNEISKLLYDYTSGNIGFDEIGQSFVDLFGSYGSNNHNNLFSGFSVIKNTEFIALNIQDKEGKDNNKYSLVINKKGKSNNPIDVVFINNKDNTKSSRMTKSSPKLIKAIADEIISRLTFNRTFFSVNNNANSNTNNNRYLYKQNGKLHVNIGGVETIYDNFADFSIKNNAFKTNQGGNAEIGYYETDKEVKSLYLNIDSISSPVEGEQADIESKSPTEIIRSATKTNPVNTRDVLLSAGNNNTYIDALLGKGEFNIPIVSEQIYYDANTPNISAYYKNGKIYLTKVGSGRDSINAPNNLVRLLIHESIHAKVAKEDLFNNKEYLVDELIDTYGAFVNAVMKDNSENANNIKAWLEKHNFTPNGYVNSLNKEDRQRWNNYSEYEKRRRFAEEWLAESLSQPTIIKYLNDTKYSDNIRTVDIADENKTIWQKIIDILVKLFNINNGNIKDNSILAQQYSILGRSNNIEVNTKEQDKIDNKPTDSTESITDPTANEISEEINTIESTIKEEDSGNIFERTKQPSRNNNRRRERRDINAATTSIIRSTEEIYSESYTKDNTINPIGIQTVPNMNDYINQFNRFNKPLIASMINNNEIKFNCQ